MGEGHRGQDQGRREDARDPAVQGGRAGHDRLAEQPGRAHRVALSVERHDRQLRILLLHQLADVVQRDGLWRLRSRAAVSRRGGAARDPPARAGAPSGPSQDAGGREVPDPSCGVRRGRRACATPAPPPAACEFSLPVSRCASRGRRAGRPARWPPAPIEPQCARRPAVVRRARAPVPRGRHDTRRRRSHPRSRPSSARPSGRLRHLALRARTRTREGVAERSERGGGVRAARALGAASPWRATYSY